VRGQVGYDVESLAKRWQWSRGKVEHFFIMLEMDRQIIRHKSNVTTLISICKYNVYQDGSKANNNTGDKQMITQIITLTDTNNKDKKKKKKKKKKKEEYTFNSESYSFESFLDLYNKKNDLKKCRTKFDQLSKNDKLKIKNTLQNYIDSTPDLKFRKNPLT